MLMAESVGVWPPRRRLRVESRSTPPVGRRATLCVQQRQRRGAPHWYHNLQRDPNVTIELGPERFQARARTAEVSQRGALAPKIDYFERQQALTRRQIPIVIFERV
jgi:F420H(2)-dependent quinone reductase